MIKLLYRRPDGTFIAEINGLPYHVWQEDPLWDEASARAAQLGNKLKLEPEREVPPLTLKIFEEAIQGHVDSKAQERRFRDGASLAGYVTSTVPGWAAEAQTFVAWRDAVWLHAYAALEAVESGERERPSVEAFLAELPEITWPE